MSCNHASFKSRRSELVRPWQLQYLFPGQSGLVSKNETGAFLISFCGGVSARQPSHFCSGKSSQNHGGRGVALRVPCVVCRLRRRANSLRLYGLFLSFLRSSEGSGVEGHRCASASYWTDGLRLLPSTSSTSMKNLAAGLLTADLNTSLRWRGPPHW